MFKVREPVQSSYSYLKTTTTKKKPVVISVTCFMFDVRHQDSGVLFWVTGQEWITNRSVFCESHWNFLNTPGDQTQQWRTGTAGVFSLSALSGPRTEVSRAPQNRWSQSLITCFGAWILALFWTLTSIRIRWIRFVSDQTLEIRRPCESEFSLWTSQRGSDCLTFFCASPPYISDLSWPGQFGLWRQTEEFDSLSSLFPFWMKRTWCKWEEMSWFIHNAAWIFHLGSGRAACLDGTLLCCGQIPSEFLETTLSVWCTFLLIRPMCSARQWINRGRC